MRRNHRDDEYSPEYPECSALHLVHYLFEIGPVQSSGMGTAPISFSEIRSWQEITGVALNSWEGRMLRRLSDEYRREMHLAESPNRPSPFIRAKEVDKEEIANRVRNILKG